MYVCMYSMATSNRSVYIHMYLFRKTKINKRGVQSINHAKICRFFVLYSNAMPIYKMHYQTQMVHGMFVIRYVIAHSIFALRSKRALNPTFIINQTFSFVLSSEIGSSIIYSTSGKVENRLLNMKIFKKKRIARRTIFGCEFFRQGPSR